METEVKISKLEFMLEQNGREHNAIFEGLKKIEEKLDHALEQKADKWVQTAVTWLLYTAAGSAVVLLVRLLIYWDTK